MVGRKTDWFSLLALETQFLVVQYMFYLVHELVPYMSLQMTQNERQETFLYVCGKRGWRCKAISYRKIHCLAIICNALACSIRFRKRPRTVGAY